MPRKRESAQLLQQLSARKAAYAATTKNTTILTRLFEALQALWGCIQVAFIGSIVWLGCGGLEWIYHKYPLPTVSVMFFVLAALVSVEAIRWRDRR